MSRGKNSSPRPLPVKYLLRGILKNVQEMHSSSLSSDKNVHDLLKINLHSISNKPIQSGYLRRLGETQTMTNASYRYLENSYIAYFVLQLLITEAASDCACARLNLISNKRVGLKPKGVSGQLGNNGSYAPAELNSATLLQSCLSESR